jgi:hypothetical protein
VRVVPFLSQVATRRVGINRWQLLEDLCYRGKWDTFTAPAGYRTDFATVPRWLQSFVPRTGRWDEAAVVHDLCCDDLRRYRKELAHLQELAPTEAACLRGEGYPRPPWADARQTDAIFRRIMGEYGVGPVMRWLIWCAVRWGALGSRYRWAGWWRDAPKVLAITAAALLAAALVTIGADHLAHAAVGLFHN